MASSLNGKMDGGMDSLPTREKLMEKYKQALTIAQKAKNARDEAVKDNKLLLSENENLKEKVKTLEKQYGTAEEMLAALTDQKLKLAMEIDDLKKQKAVFIQELKSRETAEIEAESFKRQYNRLVNENEELIKRFGSAESESVQLRKELDGLRRDNENLRQTFSNMQSEKEDLDKCFKETLERLRTMESSQKQLDDVLSKKFSKVAHNVSEWVELISNHDFEPSKDYKLILEIENIKAENEKYLNSITLLTKEKDNSEQEINDLNTRIKSLRDELNVANSDRDKMMFNLEKVGCETRQLIENSEKLTDEIDILKKEKYCQDQLVLILQKEKEDLSKIIKDNESEINQISSELANYQRLYEESIQKLQLFESTNNSFDMTHSVDLTENRTDSMKETELLDDGKAITLQKEGSVNSELSQLQEELRVFSSEIVKYREIADENEQKYASAMEELVQIRKELSNKDANLEELRMNISEYEEQQSVLKSSLSECKVQLESALEDLSHAEELKNKLKIESEIKEQKNSVILNELEEKKVLLKEKLEEVSKLEENISLKNVKLEEFDNKLKILQSEQTELINKIKTLIKQKTALEETIEKMNDDHEIEINEYKKEIIQLQKELDEIRSINSALTEEKLKLDNQLQSLLNEQFNENISLVEKLAFLQESFQSLITEKESKIKDLIQQMSSREAEITLLNESVQKLSLKNEEMNRKIELQNLNDSENEKSFSKMNSDLQEQLKIQLALVAEKDGMLNDLKNELKQVEEKAEKRLSFISDEKLNLSKIIADSIFTVKDVNKAIFEDCGKLKADPRVFDGKVLTGDDLVPEMLRDLLLELVENHSQLSEEISVLLKNHENCEETRKNLLSQLDFEKNQSSETRDQLRNLEEKIEMQSSVIKSLELEKNNFIKEIETLNAAHLNLKTSYDALNNDYLSLKNGFSELEAEKNELQDSLKTKCQQHSELVESFEKSIEKMKKRESELNESEKSNLLLIDGLNNKIFELNDQIQTLKDEISERNNSTENFESFNVKLNELNSINSSLTHTISLLEDNVHCMKLSHSEEKNELIQKLNKLQDEHKNSNELLEFKNLELKENNRIWAGRFSSLKIALKGLNKSRKDLRNQYESIEHLFGSFMNQVQEPLQERVNMVIQDSLTRAKQELIAEMQQMNQALKERGESISKLEFAIGEHQSKVKQLSNLNENLTKELVQVKSDFAELELSLKEKVSHIKQLEEENEQLRDSHYNSADADVLSTSTISRTEEHSRLKDLEESFEDRYAKLKILAVKMKKRIGELTQTLDSERTKISAERNELQEKISNMSMAVKNAQKLQELFDQSLDERDELKKKNTILESTVEALKNSEENLKSKINSLETNNQNIPVMKKHIDSLNAVIKEAKSELQQLQMENKAESIKYEELKKTNAKLEVKVQELSSSLELAKQQGKNNNVLELEIKNYEKIINELSSQINAEKNVVKSMQSEIESSKNTIVGLEEQIRILENQLKVEEERNQHLNEQLSLARQKLDDSSSLIESLNREVEDLKKQLNLEKEKSEAATLEISQLTSDFSRKELSMTSRIGTLQEQIRSLEASLSVTKQDLTTAKHEIDHLTEDYESYKLRAQTILAKKKGEFVTHGEKEAKEEVERLKKECQHLEEKVETYMTEVDTLNTRLSSLSLEKARSDKKCEEMKQALKQKIADYDILNTEFHNYKITSESTIDNLKEEISKKKHKFHSELSQQRKIIEELTTELQLREDTLAQSKDEPENPPYVSSFHEGTPLTAEREDGEGSESVPSPKTRRHSSIIPLDVLLNNPIVDENKVIVLQEQVEKLCREVNSYEVRCRHLSSLLSEAEKDSARNLNQNKILKEELRRLERSLERHPHVANTEYLKNVVFKFVTLPHGDERSRLVPVLDTLLKLSPEEMHKLNSVAKGELQAGWGSYLPSWTGL